MRVFCVGLLGCTGAPAEPEPPTPAPPQTEFARVERTVTDTTRETPALGNQEASSERVIRVVVWSDVSEAPDARPLVLLAHGVDGHPAFFEGIARYFAAEGLVVAAPAFPSTNADNDAGFAGIADLVNQPGDLAAVLDALTLAVADPTDGLYQQFDPSRVGALGHSLGSASVLGWTRHPCCRDPRVGAVVQVSTPQSLAVTFGDEDVDPVGPPVVLLHGEDDRTVPIGESETLAADFDDELAFLRLVGVTHSELVEGTADIAARHVTEAVALGLFAEHLRGEVGAAEAALSAVSGEDVIVVR